MGLRACTTYVNRRAPGGKKIRKADVCGHHRITAAFSEIALRRMRDSDSTE